MPVSNGENGNLLGQGVMRGLVSVYGWPDFEPRAQAIARVDPAVYAQYEESYRFTEEPVRDAVVVHEGDRLFWEDTPDGLRYELYPASETTFFALELLAEITFVGGVDGCIEAAMVGEQVRRERVS